MRKLFYYKLNGNEGIKKMVLCLPHYLQNS